MDPLERAKQIESIVIEGDTRKYNAFRVEPFYGQMATARGVGCNSYCAFCWINPSIIEPEGYGVSYSPREVYERLVKEASGPFPTVTMSTYYRISGCEPTIGKEHLLGVIEEGYRRRDFRGFLLETNGFILGHDDEYIKELSEFADYLFVRVSLKAGTAKSFEKKTGLASQYFELPFDAIRKLRDKGLDYRIACMSEDPVFMPESERRHLMIRLASDSVLNRDVFEEERIDFFNMTIKRLKERGFDPDSMGQEMYESVYRSLERASTDHEGDILELLECAEFRTLPLQRCCHGPYTGDAEDDLDSRLK